MDALHLLELYESTFSASATVVDNYKLELPFEMLFPASVEHPTSFREDN